MKDTVLPEEKLLKLIRGGGRNSVQGAPAVAVNAGSGVRPYVRRPISFFSVDKNIDRLLMAVLFVCLLYLLVALAYPFVGLRKINLPKVGQGRAQAQIIDQGQVAKPYEFYQGAIQSRQIFSGASSTAQAPVVLNTDIIRDINLVGVISGERPQAILEDKKTQKTYYLNKGQFLGQLQVEDIQAGKIILNYRGQRFELYL